MYTGGDRRLHLQLSQNFLRTLGGEDQDNYGYVVIISVGDYYLAEEWDLEWQAWAEAYSEEILDQLGPLQRRILIGGDLASGPRLWIPPTEAPVPQWHGLPGLERRVHILIAPPPKMAHLAEKISELLQLPLDARPIGRCQHYEYDDKTMSVELDWIQFPDEWAAGIDGCRFDLAIRPKGIATRRDWDAWIAAHGRAMFEQLKPLARPMILTDGEVTKLDDYHPESRGSAAHGSRHRRRRTNDRTRSEGTSAQ